MRNSVTMALFAVALMVCASTAAAQTTFINDDFTTASGLTSPNWSVVVIDNVGTATAMQLQMGQWRFDDPQPVSFVPAAPIAAPFASADADFLTGFTGNYTTFLVSDEHDVSGAGQVLLDFDYSFGFDAFAGTETATVDVFDGAVWNTFANLVENDVANNGASSSVSFDITAALGGATNARIRFAYNDAAFGDWQYVVDNVNMFEPPPFDVGCTDILSPTIDANSCVFNLTSMEQIGFEYTNFGSATLTPGTLITVNVDFDTVNILTEFVSPAGPVTPGGTATGLTTGVVDMSAPGAHVLDVRCTIASDADPSNDQFSLAYDTNASIATYGWVENFDSLPASNNGAFGMAVFDVPVGWINALDDAASLAGNTSPNWGPNNGATGSTNAGPVTDSTTGNTTGIYMYIEDSQSQPGDIELRTLCLDLAGNLGTPIFQFAHHSRPVPGATTDNILDVDVINETTGGTVTMSVGTFPGNGAVGWVNQQIDLSAFAPDTVRVQFRTNNNNANFVDDVGVDDCLLFDAVTPVGQAPQPGNAVFNINSAINSLGQTVASGSPGPYTASIPSAGTMNMDWSGQPNGVVLCMFGPPADGIATFPGVGQLDIGTLPLDGAGVPGTLFVFGDGSQPFPFGPLFNNFFFTGPAGTGGVELVLPGFPPGPLTRFQCVMNPPGLFFISNAVEVDIVP